MGKWLRPNRKYWISKTRNTLNMQGQQAGFWISMDIHFAAVGFLIPWRKTSDNTMMFRKYFGPRGPVYLFGRTHFGKSGDLMRITLRIRRKSICVGAFKKWAVKSFISETHKYFTWVGQLWSPQTRGKRILISGIPF